MTATLETYTKVHRELWPDQRVVDTLYDGSPSFGLIKKDTELGYAKKHIALQYGRPQGRSRKFARAQARVSSSKFAGFEIQAGDDYGVFELEGKLIRSGNHPSAAFIVDTLERESKGAMRQLKRSQHIQLCGDGSASRGRILTRTEGGGNTVIVLATPSDIKNFEPDMYITAAATALGALRGSGAVYKVISVDLQAGSLTVEGTVVTTSSWAVSDFLFADGDAVNTDTTNLPLNGFRAWVPDADPTSTPFLGQDRTEDKVRLAGWRFSAAAMSTSTIRETVMRSLAIMSRAGQVIVDERPTVLLLNPEDKADLLAEFDVANFNYEACKRQGRDVDVYYDGVTIETPIGPIDVFGEPQWAKGRAFAMNPDSWTYHTIGAQPQWVEEDGLRMLRKASEDAYETRLVVHPELSCDAPLFNANILLPT